jgi:hypothetical protein
MISMVHHFFTFRFIIGLWHCIGWSRSTQHLDLNGTAMMGQVLRCDWDMFCFPLRWALLCFQGHECDHLTLATLILSSLARWHATGFSGYWHAGSDHDSRCNGVTLLTSSFALWVLCITNLVASGRYNDPAFCDEKSGRCDARAELLRLNPDR